MWKDYNYDILKENDKLEFEGDFLMKKANPNKHSNNGVATGISLGLIFGLSIGTFGWHRLWRFNNNREKVIAFARG
mgnify:CR=1 FL=1